MTKKCDKFESLFVFSDENALLEHIKTCEDCRSKYEELNKVSELIKEVKPYYSNRAKTRLNLTKIACTLFIFVLSGITFHIADTNYNIVDTIKYGTQLTAYDLGFQTDDYGLIMVDNE